MFAIRFLFSDKVIGSASRHIGGAAGAALLATGLADAADVQAVAGAVTVLAAFGLSVGRKFVAG